MKHVKSTSWSPWVFTKKRAEEQPDRNSGWATHSRKRLPASAAFIVKFRPDVVSVAVSALLRLEKRRGRSSRRGGTTGADPAVPTSCFIQGTSPPPVRSRHYCDNIYFIIIVLKFLLFSHNKKERRGRRGPSHGALLPGVGHSRESPAWPKHPLWWQSVAKFINHWGQVFTSVLIFPAGPEGYSALYETNGCRLDARGLWAFYALLGNAAALANELSFLACLQTCFS